MNRITALVAVAVTSLAGGAFAGTGLAGDITVETEPFVSTLSRAEIRATLDGFQKSGANPWADGYDQLAGFVGSETRAEVTAEYVVNRAVVAALTGEDSGSQYFAEGVITRHAVRIAGDGFKR
ncbi:MAG: hypothetical protein JWQ76_4827 [Ramlibacter sp.]|nr:hypothetical protein [Ramlibacter sp.]